MSRSPGLPFVNREEIVPPLCGALVTLQKWDRLPARHYKSAVLGAWCLVRGARCEVLPMRSTVSR